MRTLMLVPDELTAWIRATSRERGATRDVNIR
jgi:hypothetical protein